MIATAAFALLIALALAYVLAPLFGWWASGSPAGAAEAPAGPPAACAVCGAAASDGASFCERCGAPLSAPR